MLTSIRVTADLVPCFARTIKKQKEPCLLLLSQVAFELICERATFIIGPFSGYLTLDVLRALEGKPMVTPPSLRAYMRLPGFVHVDASSF